MSKITYIVTAVLVALAGLFAILNSYVWSGFAYFILATFAVLSIFWAVWLVVQYFTTYKKELEERFSIYRAETVNKSQITAEQFQQDEPAFRKEFNKPLRREKFLKWLYVIFALACAVLFITSAILL